MLLSKPSHVILSVKGNLNLACVPGRGLKDTHVFLTGYIFLQTLILLNMSNINFLIV